MRRPSHSQTGLPQPKRSMREAYAREWCFSQIDRILLSNTRNRGGSSSGNLSKQKKVSMAEAIGRCKIR